MKKLHKDARIKNIFKNQTGKFDSDGSSDTETMGWGIPQTKTDIAHQIGFTGKGVKIAVLDSGVYMDGNNIPHKDLNIKEALNFSLVNDSPNDNEGHGTNVIGIINSQNNSFGGIGVAPDAEMYSLKIGETKPEGEAVLDALDWCIANGINIINMSFHLDSDDNSASVMESIKSEIDTAEAQGITVVSSSGNEGTQGLTFPASQVSAISVGAVNEDLTRSTFSNYGEGIDFVAPGDGIFTTILDNGYGWKSGTSMAAPFVSGIAALYKQKYPNYTNAQILEEMKKNAIDLGEPGYDINYGYGLIQAPTTMGEDERNTGIHFNGIDQFGTAQVNINADVMPTATMEFWAKPEATGNGKRQDVVGHDFWGFGRAVTVEGSDGNWGVFTGHGVWEPTKVETNQWQHIAVTYTPDDIIFKKTYNGVTETYSFHQMTGDTPSISQGRDFVSFGHNDAWGEYYTGFLSDVRIWNKELSDSELDQPLVGNESGLVAEWKLNEKSGKTGKEIVSGNNATFYNSPEWLNIYSNNSGQYDVHYDTYKADIQVRVGDVDNFGYGFPYGYDPFSGDDTPAIHGFPFSPSSNDTDGTDRIMVPSSFDYNHPVNCQNGSVCVDGYTTNTQGKDNVVRPIIIPYDLIGKTINSAKIQLFIDDIQAADPNVKSHFTFTLNGVEIPSASDVINALNQTGPKGKLITIDIPQEDLYLLNSGTAQIKIDDTTTGIGDGYAIDFAQLLINPKNAEATPNYGVKLNGISQFGQADVNINPNNANVNMKTMTIEGWINPNPTGDWQILFSNSDNNSCSRAFGISPDNRFAVCVNGTIWYPTIPVNFNLWQHVSVTYSPDHIAFYKNGEKEEYDTTVTEENAQDTINIGRNPSAGGVSYFNGDIADIRIWNKELNSSELNQSLTGNEQGLIAWWKLDETGGNTGKDSLSQHALIFNSDPIFLNDPLLNP